MVFPKQGVRNARCMQDASGPVCESVRWAFEARAPCHFPYFVPYSPRPTPLGASVVQQSAAARLLLLFTMPSLKTPSLLCTFSPPFASSAVPLPRSRKCCFVNSQDVSRVCIERCRAPYPTTPCIRLSLAHCPRRHLSRTSAYKWRQLSSPSREAPNPRHRKHRRHLLRPRP